MKYIICKIYGFYLRNVKYVYIYIFEFIYFCIYICLLQM
jgi:hypothetical protein